MPSLRGADVMGLLEGLDAAPPKNMEVDDEEKKKKIAKPGVLSLVYTRPTSAWMACEIHLA